LAAQVAVALRNASLYTQIHEALTETEVLYDISAQINAAVNLDEALLAASAPAMATGAESAQLLTFDLDEEGKPEWAIVTVVWVYEGTPRLSVGTRIYLPDLPFAKLWIDDPFTPVLISDVVEDERLIPALRDAFLATDIRASVIMPLSLAGRWVGLITVNWTTPHLFTLTDQRLYKSLATQSAVVVNNLLLYEEAQQRASLLEKLTQIEVALSQSGNEAEIIKAMAQVVEVDLSAHIALQYIDGDQSGSPTSLRTVASWRDGTVWPDDPALGISEAVDDIVGAQLWLNASDTVQFFTDAALDLRLAASSGTPVALNGFRGLALLPLFSGGRWQGLATYRWPEPHDFTSDERFVFQQMLEPMAAAVASRRAYLVQQEALAETEALYIASRRINEAASLHEIVAAVAETGPVTIVSRAVLQTIDYDTMGEAQALTVTAVWQRSNISSPVPIGTSYPISRYPHLRLFFGPDPVVFDDLQLDERLNEEAVELMEQLSVRAMIALPLWAGARQLGVLTLECDRSYDFTDREVQPYIALASQVGVALENQRLLTETSRALADAEVTQRRYTVQAWEKYLATNKSLLYQQFRRGNTSWTDELPAGLAHFETAEVPIKTDPADVKQVDVSDRPAAEEIKSRLVVPLTIRGEIIGLLGLEESAEREWTPEERSLVQAIGQQLAQAAENLRLIDETQKRAAREQRVNEIGEKIRAAQSLEEALQIAVKEVGLSLQTPAASVRLEAE
jgi:GAF domain-containing protein